MASDITIYVAIYGAVLSTIAIVWNIIKDILNKPRLKVQAGIGFITYRDETKPTKIYNFEAVNLGKRPITLTSSGIKIEGENSITFIDNTNLPKRLEEGNKISFFRKTDEFYNEIKEHQLRYLWFKDTTGKTYKSKNIKKLFSIKY